MVSDVERSAPAQEPPRPAVATQAAPGRRRRLADAAAVASFVLLGLWVTYRLWRDPATQGLAANKGDQAFFEWNLTHGARVLTEGVDPFVSYQMNVPDGVNMMANTSVLAVSLPLAPVTLAYGPQVAFTVFLTLALIGTAVSWYFVLSRQVVGSRVAAWVGAVFCAFAPGMISQANGHPNIVSQFLVPLLIWRTLKLREPGRWLRNGLWLGALVIVQAFLNLEVLFMTAVGLGLFVAIMAIARPGDARRAWRPFLAGLGVAGGLALVALAYPLSVQFFGAGAYEGLPQDIRRYGADLASYVAFSRESLAGDAGTSKGLAQNSAEENAFFGWPLVVLVLALVVWLRRSAVVVALAVVAVVFAAFSLGPEIRLNGTPTDVPSVWTLFTDVPVLSSAVPTRWALAVTPVVGLILAIGADRAARAVRRAADTGRPGRDRTLRIAAVAAFALALVPVAPTALPATALPEAPAFLADGTWRAYAPDGRSLMFLPPASSAASNPLRWSAEQRNDIPLAQGYFLGPNGKDGTAMFSAPVRPLTAYLGEARRKAVPRVTPKLRAQAVEDLRYWRVGAVVLAPPYASAAEAQRLRTAMTRVLGFEPRRIGGVEVWDVRPLTA